MAAARRVMLPVAALIRDSRVQPRETINATAVSEYAEAMAKIPVARAAGILAPDFPPVTVFEEQRDGQRFYWLADGFHRALAAEEAELDKIAATVEPGDVYTAIMFATGANAQHGLRRSNRDKHRAVRMLLDHPTTIREEWGDARVALHVGVSSFLVRTVRREREVDLGLPHATERRGMDGKVYTMQAPEGAHTQQEAFLGLAGTITPIRAGVVVEPFSYACETGGCGALMAQDSWHCPTCGIHWPKDLYPEDGPCPECTGATDDPAPLRALPVANVVVVDPPKQQKERTTQAPYSPGTMKASGATLAYERLVRALDLIESLAGAEGYDVVAESPDPAALSRRLSGARQTLLVLEACQKGAMDI